MIGKEDQEKWAAMHLDPDAVEALGYSIMEYIDKFAPTKVKIFIASYAGNATSAALDAGYGVDSPEEKKGSAAAMAGHRIMSLPLVRRAIGLRGDKDLESLYVAKRHERLAFLTSVIRDEGQSMKERLKAVELLGKASGDFVDKRIIEGGDNPIKVHGLSPELKEKLNEIYGDE